MKIHTRARAFTLIELLIVITIIGILAVATLPRLFGGLPQARDAQRKADLASLATAMELWASEEGGGLYPVNASTLCINPSLDPLVLDLTPYLSSIPADPLEGSFPDVVGGPDCSSRGGASYLYRSTDTGRGFVLLAQLEGARTEGPGIYDVNSVNVNGAASNTTREVLDSWTLCDDGSCELTGALYAVGR